ncbi:MAG TPA: N-acetylglucosaminyldiphospho-UDP N-acetyl-beta-D-mannosaminyltransferase, partial [Janthinobacterium sp.]|nr:N-acetylglucosaminyldiphospho-UDP N-acetyl-beta-D-mannosaminyltransferase [Janthinobacterium sp.]
GHWHEGNLAPLRAAFQAATALPGDFSLDLGQLTGLDSAAIGQLILLYGHQSKVGRGFRIAACSPLARKVLRLHCADYLLAPAAAGLAN